MADRALPRVLGTAPVPVTAVLGSAANAGVAARTVARFEVGAPVRLETVEALRSALVQGGALFVDVDGHCGVTLRKA